MNTIKTNYTYSYQRNRYTPTKTTKPKTEPQNNHKKEFLIGTTLGLATIGTIALIRNRRSNNVSNQIAKGSENLKEEVIKFLDKKPEHIAEGFKGKVYKKDNQIIKVAKGSEFNFKNEAEILEKLPENLQDGQKLIAYYDNTKHGAILVSKYVKGKSKALEEKNFEPFFKTLLEHDKAGILHNDLNIGNWRVKPDNSINLIDYGESKMFTQADKPLEIYPDFLPNTNLINFEQNGITQSIKEWHSEKKDVKYLFKSYLQEKSKFLKKHIDLLKSSENNNAKAIYYEENLAKVFENPSNEVMECELHRMQTLHSFEDTDTYLTLLYEPKNTIQSWKNTIELNNGFKNHATKQTENSSLSTEEQTYFKNQKEIANEFDNKFSEWSKGTTNWLHEIKDTKPEELKNIEAKQLKANWTKEEKPIQTTNLLNYFNFNTNLPFFT